MPKNKGKFKSRTPDITLPQQELASLTQRVLQALRPHAVKIAAVVGGVTVVLVGFSIWSGIQRKREGQATAAFQELLDKATAPVAEADQPVDPTNPQPADPDAPKTFAARAQAALTVAEQLKADYGAAPVSSQALLLEGGLAYDLGKYDQAIDSYRRFLDKGSKVRELVVLGREGLGYAIEAKALGLTDATAKKEALFDAQKTFADIEVDEHGPFYPLAAYHQARIMVLRGEKDKALETFKKALAKNPLPSLTQEINDRIALLEAK